MTEREKFRTGNGKRCMRRVIRCWATESQTRGYRLCFLLRIVQVRALLWKGWCQYSLESLSFEA